MKKNLEQLSAFDALLKRTRVFEPNTLILKRQKPENTFSVYYPNGDEYLLENVTESVFMRFCQVNRLTSTHFDNNPFGAHYWAVIEAGWSEEPA